MIFYYHPIIGLQYDFELVKKKLPKKDITPIGSKYFKKKETRRDN